MAKGIGRRVEKVEFMKERGGEWRHRVTAGIR
jgi:hypothetical protein